LVHRIGWNDLSTVRSVDPAVDGRNPRPGRRRIHGENRRTHCHSKPTRRAPTT